MHIKIEATTKETRRDQRGIEHTGVKVGDSWMNLVGDCRKFYGKEVEVELVEEIKKERGQPWRLYKIKEGMPGPLKTENLPGATSQQRTANGQLFWTEFERIVWAAHDLAFRLEPDSEASVPDRARARAALVATFLIPFMDGKIEAPKLEEQGDTSANKPPF